MVILHKIVGISTKICFYHSLKIAGFYNVYSLIIYQFPKVAITNYHQFGGLKQQKFVLSEFRRPEVTNQDVSLRAGASERDSLPCL